MSITKIEDVNTLLAMVDVFAARPVNDTIKGTAADDALYGDDEILDSSQNVVLLVNDRILGLGGNDALYGGLGDDSLIGGAGADFLDGSDGNDLLLGGEGNDILHGAAGDDILDGGEGADIMRGGLGNNIYYVDNAGDQALEDPEDADSSIDSVISIVTYALGVNEKIEELILTGNGAINGTGNKLNNVLVGNKGVNTLTGGDGADIYFIQNTGDSVVETGGDTTTKWDKVFSSATWTITDGMKIDELALIGSKNINATGDGQSNLIYGNAGQNRIFGGAGDDFLGGVPLTVTDNDGTQWLHLIASLGQEDGKDTLYGGTGNDWLFLGQADKAIENPGEGTHDRVIVSFNHNLEANIEELDFYGHLGSAIALTGTGNALDNLIISNLGADRLLGKTGDDTYELFNSAIKVIEKANQGSDTVATHVDFRLPVNVENLVLLDTFEGFTPAKGYGNKLNNDIVGNAADNYLDGRAGDDNIYGDDGNDQLTGGPGKDDFIFDTALNGKTNVDEIHDFRTVDDQIVLATQTVDATNQVVDIFADLPIGALPEDRFVSGSGSNATLPIAQIIFDTDTGRLYYDADGTGDADPVAFAVLDPTPVGYVGMISASDFEVFGLA